MYEALMSIWKYTTVIGEPKLLLESNIILYLK